ncbi:hypothetical protein OWV82_022701 [Melia azedarach]|uniref:Uncharacterized protein n=1 Tax=Melia azedarach TaxID=155640 RepID=A0ACC1WXK8_MELAZ|nr:hypothetical protein OWV82_022701 [Melia azedarach]
MFNVGNSSRVLFLALDFFDSFTIRNSSFLLEDLDYIVLACVSIASKRLSTAFPLNGYLATLVKKILYKYMLMFFVKYSDDKILDRNAT